MKANLADEYDATGAWIVYYLMAVLIVWVYRAAMESSVYQATLGKMVLRLKVVDGLGGRISFARASGRHFAMFISTLILCIGYLMVGWTAKKQGLHDMMAGTFVIRS